MCENKDQSGASEFTSKQAKDYIFKELGNLKFRVVLDISGNVAHYNHSTLLDLVKGQLRDCIREGITNGRITLESLKIDINVGKLEVLPQD